VVTVATAAPSALAAEPVLFFSCLTVAPKAGLGDGLGEGAIVTVWTRTWDPHRALPP
jgi:hypothetical protein